MAILIKVHTNMPINAVKAVREEFNWGLWEAMRSIEMGFLVYSMPYNDFMTKLRGLVDAFKRHDVPVTFSFEFEFPHPEKVAQPQWL